MTLTYLSCFATMRTSLQMTCSLNLNRSKDLTPGGSGISRKPSPCGVRMYAPIFSLYTQFLDATPLRGSTELPKERHWQRSEQTCSSVTKLLSLTVLMLQRMKSLRRERSPFYVCTSPDLMNASIPCGIPNFVSGHRNDLCAARRPSTYVCSSCISQSKDVLPGREMEDHGKENCWSQKTRAGG